MKLHLLDEIQGLIIAGAIFFVSHSGGKDSQAMYALLRPIIPTHQLVVVHADLGEVEWSGVQDHIWANTDHAVNVVRAKKTLLGMVEQRGMWPSSSCRQCTSDLKRGPIMKFIRNYLSDRGLRVGVNCTVIRAEESKARSKKIPFRFNTSESCGHRDVWDWMPIFNMSTADVFQAIADAGQNPFWAYERNEMLSCVFCIMGSVNDLRHGAERNPELYRKFVELEKKIGHTMFMRGKTPVPLEEHIGIKVNEGR
ncbi:phosphoadenosine phosphosulfate reductase family protein [Paenibacillus contaminans]|uniref:Phosphoadenosine phosphosulfate reductase n=1 Tax=Paenibacillus contaminans TaxID=450362 RepID=A0A329MG58_9BACL|nr:phosphoadenosine phosphosulfate reductase family protein [Paenibacillus contaminans]RAV18854.1 phosphoadenosine phosphosulfate reductase [Paenibacillus contaminans]